MQHIYQLLATKLETENIILATIIDTKGSTPREIGAKMLIRQDGQICGTIGGGAGEAKVYQAAQTLFQNHQDYQQKLVVDIDLSSTSNRTSQGVCGGKMQVLLELWKSPEYLDLAKQILELIQNNNSCTIITPVDSLEKPYLTNQISAKIPHLETDKFIEPLIIHPTLLIIGAGHIAVPLAKIAAISGFKIIIQDDRPEFANSLRFPNASQIYALHLDSLVPILSQTPELYTTLVTRGYLQDIAALKLILPYQPKYIGMIGSKKRVQTVYHNLSIDDSSCYLNRIYAPIGLDIGALTPEEIAVSICAELIKIKRGGSGLSLSQ